MALPIILAGPMVRRVEPRLVTIWIALSEKAPVKVSVWQNHQFATATPGVVRSGDSPWAEAEVEALTIGPNFHIAVVTVENKSPAPPLMPGTIYAYDVQIGLGPNAMTDLRSMRMLEDGSGDADIDPQPPRLALGYSKDRLPSFATTPVSADDLVLAHASCRNTVGPGHDAMVYLDETLEASIGLANERPHQLFLTGDQIYADDVSLLLLRNLNDLGLELFGRHETLPVDVPGVGLTDVAASLIEFPPERRGKLVRDVASFTTTSGSNHLLSFAEYCAMYLSAWSVEVWSPLPVPDDIYLENKSSVAELLTPHEKCAIEDLNKKGQLTDDLAADAVGVWKREQSEGKGNRFEKQKSLTEVYRRGVPHAQRVLANVATYMIFDDHEVTDDWNLTQQWRNRVNTSPLGRAVIRNALMTYALFQGWGNDPKQFATGDGAKLLNHISKIMTGPATGPTVDVATKIDALLGLSGSDPRIKWNYQIDGATHRAVVLDTRTRRRYSGRISPPDLLGDSLKAQVPKGPLGGGLETLVVVSPVPVLGPVLIDAIGQPLRIVIAEFTVHAWKRLFPGDVDHCAPEEPVKGLEEFDAESWARNDDALESLLERLASYESVVLLSGDVHYSGSFVLDYWKKGQVGRATARIVQLTSSPARNLFKPLIEKLLRSAGVGQRLEKIGMPAVRFAWKDSAADNLAFAQGSSVRPGLRARLNRDPVLVPGAGWPDGTTVVAEPDWRWRLDLVRDPRTDSERPPILEPPPTMGTDFDETNPIDGYVRLATRHAIAARQHFDHLRQIVFPNNIGIVRFFSGTDGKRVVRHEIVSEDPTDPRRSTPDAPNTVHEILLGPPAEDAPDLATRSPEEDDNG